MLSSVTVQAADLTNVYRGGGFYGALTLGAYEYLGDDELAESDQTSSVVGLGIGFRRSGAFGVEANYLVSDLDPKSPVNDDAQRDVALITGSALFHWHITRSFELYGRAGAGAVRFEDEEIDYRESGPVIQAGGGMQFWLGSHFQLRAEASYFFGQLDDEEEESANAEFIMSHLQLVYLF